MRNVSLRDLILMLLLASAAVMVQACRQSEPAEQPKPPAEEAAKPAEQPKEPVEAAKGPAEAAGDGDLEPIKIDLPTPHY
jgi:hypothetical protein